MSETKAKLCVAVNVETTLNGKFTLRGSELTAWDTFDELVAALRSYLCESEKSNDKEQS